VLDLRTLNPLDEQAIMATVRRHGKVAVLTEETVTHSFAEALAGRIAAECFADLDAPVKVLGSTNTPAVPLNAALEQCMLPNADKVAVEIDRLLAW
jgi:2-oxoisovalerate dehydrogenase E1 component